MKKALVLTIFIIFFFCSASLAQQSDFKHFYLGIGGSYAIEDFQDVHPLDDSWGVNAKLGWRFHEDISLQFDFDYLDKFEGDGKQEQFQGEVKVLTYFLSLKGYFPINYYNIRPFIIAGGGVMYADADLKSSSGSEPSFAPHDTGVGFKIGGGFDYFINENFSVGIEGNYTFGAPDTKLNDVRYYHGILGVSYHFDLP
jgi:opacity protein-like surface antigen